MVMSLCSRCSSAFIYNIPCATSVSLDWRSALHMLRRSSVFLCAVSAYLACAGLLKIPFRRSSGILASLNSWVPAAICSWPRWIHVLFVSSCCPQTASYAQGDPDRALLICPSMLMPVFTLLLGPLKLIWGISMFYGFKHYPSCHF